MAALRHTMQAIGLDEKSDGIKEDTVTMKFDAEPTRGLGALGVKVEINTRETVPYLGLVSLPYVVSNP